VTRWRLRHPSSLHGRQWEDGTVLYHALSGDTHLLEPSVGAALLLLREGPRDIQAMAAQCGADPELLERLLTELSGLGVVERA